MKKLKNILKYKYFYIIILIVSILYALIYNYVFTSNSKYNGNEELINGYINNYYIDGNKLNIELIGKEKIICIYYFESEEELNRFNYKIGDYIELIGTMSIPSNNTIFNLFNYKKYLYIKNINYIFKAESIVLLKNNPKLHFKIKNAILKRINESINKDYLYTFILGNNKYIDSNVMKSYRVNGVSHLFAISGMHVALISAILLKILKRFKFKYLIVILFLLFYMFLTNYSPSILRAGVMFILLYINKKFNLKIKTINIMVILLFLLVLINPKIIFEIGFQYSYIISFYLIYFNKIIGKKDNKIYKLFIVSFISFLASLPITINNFFQINFLSIFINIIFVPIISALIFPLSLITFFIPILDNILNIFISIFESISLYFSSIKLFIFSFKSINIYIIVFYYIVIFYVLNQIKNNNYKSLYILIILLTIHYNINYINKNLEVTFIDVGQGDSTIINLPHNRGSILIDTGGIQSYSKEDWEEKNNDYSLGENICLYLKSEGIKKLDYLILTHGDYDHLGETLKIITCIKIDNVIFNYYDINNNEKIIIDKLKSNKIKYLFYKEGNEINISNYKFVFINPIKNYGNENDNSLVIYFKYNDYDFLFTGDISKSVESEIIKKYSFDIDVLKVPHHGSNTSSEYNFLKNIKPKYSILSVGLNNKFGHPSKDTIYNLKNLNSKIYNTSIDGSIKIIINKNIKIYKSNT